MRIQFEAEIFRWSAREQDWYFVALPEEFSADVKDVAHPPRGFGAVRVEAVIGSSRWRTSIFPDKQRGAYVLPLKRAVRDAEGVEGAGTVTVELEVLGV
ncbi:DUF1905 domain-containing protein [Microbacterium sp. VKM Ac-2870]|uniref:DUF1905 domain-containing protein n=1 Tax=Microbacterium sp. VKM Ac-2870 TaxID=2783825 RepID=UPI00188BA356|nr:DUF1905 domain-containing protein [Microbacterium sp. VKM Ac-2870]MBF4561147.1 DUF1905 domain-containing protein [Microbacterium sp. VKM Ac-2870]